MPHSQTDKRLLLTVPEDNCLVVCAPLQAGETVVIEGRTVTLPTSVAIGHKVARRDIVRGEKIIRYGALIGSAVSDIAIGDHIHLHNLESDYIPTYTHEDGHRYAETHA
jgi:hypothetical protein